MPGLNSSREKNMSRIIVVTSGKGGVGKTTTSASIACGFALKGFKTCVIDFDVGLRNLDLIMGVERRIVYDFVNVINGEAKLNQALIKDKRVENLYTLVASQTRDKDALTKEGVSKVLDDLKAMDFDYIICDSPAGIEQGALMALYFADDALIGILASKSRRAELGEEPVKEHLVITRYNPERVQQQEMLSIEDVIEILSIKLLGVIPESESVLTASNQGEPVILMPDSQAGQAYSDLVERFLGNDLPHRFVDPKRKGLFSKIFGG